MPRSSLLAALSALVLAFALMGSLALVPAASVTPAASATPAVDALHGLGVPAAGQKLLEMAGRAGQADSASATLAAVGALPAASVASARSPDLASALARLGPAPDASFLSALDPATAQALVPLVDAVADAGRQVDAAFAGLSLEERALLMERILDLDLPGERTLDEQELDAKVAALAQRVDVGAMRVAAADLVSAAEAFLATQPTSVPAPVSPVAPDLPMALTAMGSSCFTGGFSVVSPGGLVEVGFTGSNGYAADSWAEGKYDNNAHTHAQGAAASRGVGALVDKEGNDRYAAQADAQFSAATPGVHKGMFAYTFAQGALYGTNEPRSEALSIDVRCKDVTGQLPPTVGDTALCQRVSTVGVGAGLDVCNLGKGIASPVSPGGIGQPALPPPLDNLGTINQPAPPGGTAPVAGVPPCDYPAYAVLVDIQGQDDYFARAGSTDNGLGCDWGSWSGVAAQGSAPAKGIAALVDAALDTGNTFTALANSQGTGCFTLGARSDTAAQGFGGAFMWDYWDRPPFDPLLLTDLSLGLLVRGGLCGVDLNNLAVNQIAVNLNDPCPLAWADDSYFADATTNNAVPGGVSWARTYAQGSGNGKLTASEVPGGPYDAFGVGGLVDLFGDDRHTATAYALSPAPPGAAQEPRVVAQGAATSAAGVLVDVGDVDAYSAMAFFGPGAGVPVPVVPFWSLPWIVAQADATVENQVSFKACTPFTCTTQDVFYGVGILVDVFGSPSDSYSQALPMGCAWNGNLPLSPWIWGTVLPPSCAAAVHNPSATPPPGSQGFILGIDW